MRNVLGGEGWDNLQGIIIFGFGRQGKKALKTLKKDFCIKAIIDNDKSKVGSTADNIPILQFNEKLSELLFKYKIIITASERYYKEIAKQLETLNLKANNDFVMYKQFIFEWYFRFKNKLYIPKTDLPITSFCSLNCEKCHIFIPYWKCKEDYEITMLKHSVDLYFKYVDYVLDMDILGGEPFLFKYLDEIIKYIGDNYREKIGYLGLITNGTITPKNSTIELIKRFDMNISISDYSKELNYKEKVDNLCTELEKMKISYLRNTDIVWFDFGLPTDDIRYPGEQAARHMSCCNTIYHVIHEGKFYCCGTAWAAQKSGLFPSSNYGYVDLESSENDSYEIKRKILECSLGTVPNGYLEFCQVCGGFGIDNTIRVDTARQISKNGDKNE